MNFLEIGFIPALEERVGVDVFIFLPLGLGETIHVELADKRGDVLVLEVFGEDGLGEGGKLVDEKSITIFHPVDLVSALGILLQRENTSSMSKSLEIKRGICGLCRWDFYILEGLK